MRVVDLYKRCQELINSGKGLEEVRVMAWDADEVECYAYTADDIVLDDQMVVINTSPWSM